MNILGYMEAAHAAMREVEWRLDQANICTTIVDWRLIDYIWPFYSKIVYDNDLGSFCTVVAVQDDDYHIRDIFEGIELFNTFVEAKFNKSDTVLFEKFLSRLDKETLNEIIHNEMGV
jgi:hypothetical protein